MSRGERQWSPYTLYLSLLWRNSWSSTSCNGTNVKYIWHYFYRYILNDISLDVFISFSVHLLIHSISLAYLPLSRSIAIWSCPNNCGRRKMVKLVGFWYLKTRPPTLDLSHCNRLQLKLSESTCMSFHRTFHSC